MIHVLVEVDKEVNKEGTVRMVAAIAKISHFTPSVHTCPVLCASIFFTRKF